MHYPTFRAQGLCVSSGVVEAGCEVAIGASLTRACMHWTVAGADAITAPRCCVISSHKSDGRPAPYSQRSAVTASMREARRAGSAAASAAAARTAAPAAASVAGSVGVTSNR
jgi:hypothetical protein